MPKFVQLVECEECKNLIPVEDSCFLQWMRVCKNCKFIFDLDS